MHASKLGGESTASSRVSLSYMTCQYLSLMTVRAAVLWTAAEKLHKRPWWSRLQPCECPRRWSQHGGVPISQGNHGGHNVNGDWEWAEPQIRNCDVIFHNDSNRKHIFSSLVPGNRSFEPQSAREILSWQISGLQCLFHLLYTLLAWLETKPVHKVVASALQGPHKEQNSDSDCSSMGFCKGSASLFRSSFATSTVAFCQSNCTCF